MPPPNFDTHLLEGNLMLSLYMIRAAVWASSSTLAKDGGVVLCACVKGRVGGRGREWTRRTISDEQGNMRRCKAQ
jgi:hypothetical protein